MPEDPPRVGIHPGRGYRPRRRRGDRRFTRDARKEASRDGAPPVDLVDRDLLLDKLKELRLGVDVVAVEQASLNADWFESI